MKKDTDICIIGSGAGGAVAAYALGKAGFSVVVLEAGPRFDISQYTANQKDWELRPNPFVDEDEKRKHYTTEEKLQISRYDQGNVMFAK